LKIWIDADACPVPVKEIVFRASERRRFPVTLVANQLQRVPKNILISQIQVGKKLVAKGVHVINPRGEAYTEANIRDRLAMRDLMDNLRGAGMVSGGPPTYGEKEKQLFSNSLDRWLQKALTLRDRSENS
jgi:uncharacterized protein YaiI (UPF0178 family)